MTDALRHSARVRTRPAQWIALALLLAAAVSVQVAVDGADRAYEPARAVLWVRSPELMKRLALGFDAIVADVYWIRAVQHYGRTRLSDDPDKSYDLLYPLLDLTTTLDPRFNIAYRFGAILLAEAYPNGPGRPDQAIALLEKGIANAPERWEYYHDAGFVEYWWRQDSRRAAEWLLRASEVPGAPLWLPQVAATFLAEGGAREAARQTWIRLLDSEQEWMRRTARRGLMQLDAEHALEALQDVVTRYRAETGRAPRSWQELLSAGRLRGIPLDPTGLPYVIDPESGAVDVARESEIAPLPRRRTAMAPG